MSRLIFVSQGAEPISLELARLQLRLDAEGSPPEHPLDALASASLAASRDYAEQFTGMDLATRSYEYRIDAFADIDLPRYPVQAIPTITYLDADGVEQPLDSAVYAFDAGQADLDPTARLSLVDGQEWPATNGDAECVRVAFDTGFADIDASPPSPTMPAGILTAMLVHLMALVDDPSGNKPPAVDLLLRPYRRRLGLA